jgi:hypothetical protein
VAVRHSDPGLRSIVFDCAGPGVLARWWAETIPGYHLRPYTDEGIAWLREQGIDDVMDDPSVVLDPDEAGPTIWFNKVPEPKVTKNRVHIDVNVVDDSEIDRLVARGASVLRPLGAVPDEPWAVMADPEGNEFCAFPPRPS